MKKLIVLSVVYFAVISFFISCKKEDPTPTPTPTPATTPAPPSVNPQGADGVLAALKIRTYQNVGGFDIDINIGVASCGFNVSGSSCVDGGTVKCAGKSLTSTSNACYVYNPTTTEPNGIEYSGPVTWEVSGNSANGIVAFTYDNTDGWPTMGDVSLPTGNINRNNPLTLTSNVDITNADSTIFVVSAGSSQLTKVVGPGISSVTFTAAEMGTLGTGYGIVQVNPYKMHPKVYGGKTFYFVNMVSLSKSATFE